MAKKEAYLESNLPGSIYPTNINPTEQIKKELDVIYKMRFDDTKEKKSEEKFLNTFYEEKSNFTK